ncbi:MAG: exodeoxyribonuclease III [Cytophagales bacterium]|nr:MAG: exodeoxyribonuclease III [Cytophagales bacterium]TAF60791.1 MAG: exodeoxyribonuclease III [Cytophagales bacterium]
MKILSYNLNGIRAAIQKGLIDWLKATDADVICIQELKADYNPEVVALFEQLGYHVYWHAAQKKGYSGTAIMSKTKPLSVEIGCGVDIYDAEGRVLRADFEQCSVMCVYMPSGTTGDERQAFKYKWLDYFLIYAQEVKKKYPNLVICGDFNICHQAIDIHNPVSNKNSSGFLPEERAWLTKFIDTGFIDSFRHFNKEPHHYTWWSYRAGSRGKNLGWRIDYQMAAKELENRLTRCVILPQAMHSDHCPVLLELKK